MQRVRVTQTKAATYTQDKHHIRYLNLERTHSILDVSFLSLSHTHAELRCMYLYACTHNVTCIKVHTVPDPHIHAAITRPLSPRTPPSSSYRVCSSWIHSVCLSCWTDGPVSVVQLWRLAPEIQPVADFHDRSCLGTVSPS